MLDITIDASEVERALQKAIASLGEGFPRAMNQIRQEMERSVELNFRGQGRPAAWKPLSPVTIARRRMQKRPPVAGMTTILRNTDALRRSVTDANAPHSVNRSNAFEAVVGTDLNYAAKQQLGEDNIPPRPFLLFQDGDEERFAAILQRDINQRLMGR
jgi:phage gpG-like protein